MAYLLESSKNPDKPPGTLSALQNFVQTMTKMDDWGAGRKTPGDIFVQFVKEVFEALGLTDTYVGGGLCGTTIRQDIIAAIEEFEEITNNFKPENP